MTTKDELGQRMKAYENATETKINGNQPWIVRLDGHSFSKFTRGFNKPFDPRISNTMINTMNDLVQEFHATLGFTQSDEITLVFPPVKEELGQSLIFSGRVTKIASVMSGYCSARFNYHMNNCEFDEVKEKSLKVKATTGLAYFDGRVFNVPNESEVFQNLLWRSVFDGRRNSISGLAHANMSTKEMHGKSSKELINILKEKGIDWESYPDYFKFGAFSKREKFMKETLDPIKNEMVWVERTRVTNRSFNLSKMNPLSAVVLIFSKYWADYDDHVKEVTETNK